MLNIFYGCTGLTSINIPNSITSIGEHAFDGCSALTYVVSKMENPCSITYDCFSQDVFCYSTLYIPKGTKDKYKSMKYWSKFVFIEEGEPTGINTIKSENGETVEEQKRFDASGNQINKSHRGLNIIRMSNGTVKKVLVK